MGKFLQEAVAFCEKIKKCLIDVSDKDLLNNYNDDTWKDAVRSDPEVGRQLKQVFEHEHKFEENLFAILNDLLAEIDALEHKYEAYEDVIKSLNVLADLHN